MFDSQAQDSAQRPVIAVSIGHLARESKMGLEAPRAYLVPVLFWITHGQGRILIDGEVRGYTAHNAIYVPPNTPHACEVSPRTQGSAVFFGAREDLPRPSESLHLRVTEMSKQNELNQLVEGLRRDFAVSSPLQEEVLFHRAALTLLWLAGEAMDSPTSSALAQPNTLSATIARRSGA